MVNNSRNFFLNQDGPKREIFKLLRFFSNVCGMWLEGKSVWTVHCHKDIAISGLQTKRKAKVNCNSRDLLIEWEVERQPFGGNVDAADPAVSFCHHILTIRGRTALRIPRASFLTKWLKSSWVTRDPRKAYFQMLPQSISGVLNNFIQHFISPGLEKPRSFPATGLPFSFLHCLQLWGFSTRIFFHPIPLGQWKEVA